MSRQTIHRRPVLRKSAPPVRPHRRLLKLLFDKGDRLLYPINRNEGNFAVLKGLSRRTLDLADLRKLIARMVFPSRPSATQELLSAINLFELACANRVRNGRSDRCLV
jgi:hypothetical protein